VTAALVLIVLARMDEEFDDAGPDFEMLRTFLAGWVADQRRMRRHAQEDTP